MQQLEQFTAPTLPAGFYWFNEPATYQLGDGLKIYTNEETDFWQRTHYGFRRDDGHCCFRKLSGDFAVITQVAFSPRAQYDQCGLMVRLDAQNWIKLSTEYEDETVSRLGSVVTNDGFSDWATQDIPSSQREMWYRIHRRGRDFLLESSNDGWTWTQMRITHLGQLPAAADLEVGPYACSPIGDGFWSHFKWLQFAENDWVHASE